MKAAFSNTLIIPGLLNGKGAGSPKCCDRGIMRRSPPGAKRRAEDETRLRRPDLIERHGDARRPSPSGARQRRTRTNEMNLIQQLEAEAIEHFQSTKTIPEFRPGDTLRVGVKVVEGERTRIQNFEGVCIARANRGLGSSLHRPQDQLRRGRRARLPALFAERRFDRGRAPRRRPPRQALLSARPHRQVGPHRRAPRHPPPRQPPKAAGRDGDRRELSLRASTTGKGGRCGGRLFRCRGVAMPRDVHQDIS